MEKDVSEEEGVFHSIPATKRRKGKHIAAFWPFHYDFLSVLRHYLCDVWSLLKKEEHTQLEE